jgi:hypothetical protein
MRLTDRQATRALEAQKRLLASGNEDAWQAACSEEQAAAQAHMAARLQAGKPPLAIVLGTLVQAGLLLRSISVKTELRNAMMVARRTLDTAILHGGDADA